MNCETINPLFSGMSGVPQYPEVPKYPEVPVSYPVVPVGTPATVESDGRTSVGGVAGTSSIPVPTNLTPTKAESSYVVTWRAQFSWLSCCLHRRHLALCQHSKTWLIPFSKMCLLVV